MADHVFRDKHRNEYLAVVYVERMSNELRDDHRVARPGLDRGLASRILHLAHLFDELELALFAAILASTYSFASSSRPSFLASASLFWNSAYSPL